VLDSNKRAHAAESSLQGSKRQVLAFYFAIRICYMDLISKCRKKSDLGLCMSLGLAKRMPLRSGDFRRILWRSTFLNRKSPLHSGILFPSFGLVHIPRSDSHLHFIWNLHEYLYVAQQYIYMSYKASYDIYMFCNTMCPCYVVEGLFNINVFFIKHIYVSYPTYFLDDIFRSTTYYTKQHIFFNNIYLF